MDSQPSLLDRRRCRRWPVPRCWLTGLLPLLVGLLLLWPSSNLLQAESRSAWVAEQISAQNLTLPGLRRSEKYAQMGESLMSFYRATNYLFWADLAKSSQLNHFGGGKETRIWLHGDCHVENIGALTNNKGQVVYDLDDFDDSVIGDYQLDLWRLATSLILLMREQGGFSPSDEENLVDILSKSYLKMLGTVRHNNAELSRTFTASNTPSPLSDFLAEVGRNVSQLRMLEKFTSNANGHRVFDFYKPDIEPLPPAIAASLVSAFPAYIQTLPPSLRQSPGYFNIKSVAKRVRGGMGSMGVVRYYVLIEGPTASQDDDHILDVKTQNAPYPWPYLDLSVRNQILAAANGNHAMRTVLAGRALGYQVDEYMGNLVLFGTWMSVRERTPVRGSIDVHELSTPPRVSKLAEVWGAVLAIAHARADQDSSPTLIPYNFEVEVLKRIGDQQDAFLAHVRQVALNYANQVVTDQATFSRTLLHRQPLPVPSSASAPTVLAGPMLDATPLPSIAAPAR